MVNRRKLSGFALEKGAELTDSIPEGFADAAHSNVMTIVEKIAERLAGTRFGHRALVEDVDLSTFKTRPSLRIYLGFLLIALSYLTGLLGMVLCGYLSHQWREPLVLVLGGGALMVVVHVIFAAGVYLAGANYAMALLRWGAGKFLRKHLTPR